ncbi:cupin domain-containing protein [Streptomyces sp. NPDC091265]|uniref:cupin domain-containing protein n=1 Tax=unclassified Streptomyces TaxID=2593676 RepID=UPI00344C668A
MTATQPTGPSQVLETKELRITPSGPVEELLVPYTANLPTAPFQTSRWGVDPGLWSNWDQHDALELWLVSEGSGSVWRGDVETPVGPGDAVLMPSRVKHRLHNTGDVPMRLFSVWWQAPAAEVPGV